MGGKYRSLSCKACVAYLQVEDRLSKHFYLQGLLQTFLQLFTVLSQEEGSGIR